MGGRGESFSVVVSLRSLKIDQDCGNGKREDCYLAPPWMKGKEEQPEERETL
jgi:hypothetical protein